jgi:SAM-dependent methyltransferase
MERETEPDPNARAWQVGVWDRISQIYLRELDRRFAPVIEQVIRRADLRPGNSVLDLGTGTGAVALKAAPIVGESGRVTGADIGTDMLNLARERAADLGSANVDFREGGAEAIPAEDVSFDAVLASLSLMYVIDRAAAARECARVLRPGGRFVAAVWARPEECDIVLFQQTAGRFAPAPPAPGVGPGALADTAPFVTQLVEAGIDASVETESLGFDFDDFASAWDVLAGVTTASLDAERREEAKRAVQAAMWPEGKGPRHFRNVTQFIVGNRRR